MKNKMRRIIRLTVELCQPAEWDCLVPGPLVPTRRFELVFKLEKVMPDAPMLEEIEDFVVKMTAKYHDDPLRMRDELLASKYVDGFGMTSDRHLWDESVRPIEIQIIDPHKILSWLYPNMDVADSFNQTNPQNDQPLRLLEGHP